MLATVVPQNQNFTEVIMFSCPSKRACKTLWKSCVEHHTFFRFVKAFWAVESILLHSLVCRTVKTDIMKRPSTNSLFRRGSTFRFSGRTQFRLLQEGTQSKRRSSTRFERYVKERWWGRKVTWSCHSLPFTESVAGTDLHGRLCDLHYVIIVNEWSLFNTMHTTASYRQSTDPIYFYHMLLEYYCKAHGLCM